MERYVTIQSEDGEITVLTERDDYTGAINGKGVADWVWQHATSPEAAKKQHEKKVDQWRDDPSLETY